MSASHFGRINGTASEKIAWIKDWDAPTDTPAEIWLSYDYRGHVKINLGDDARVVLGTDGGWWIEEK